MIWIDYIKPQLCLEIQFNYFKPLRFFIGQNSNIVLWLYLIGYESINWAENVIKIHLTVVLYYK